MRYSVAVAALLSAVSVGSAHAHEANEIFFRVGLASVQPDSDSGTVLGGGVSVKDDTGLAFSGTYFVNKHFGVEVLAALPFEHDIEGTGALKGVDIGSTKHLPPTVTLQYYPFDSETVQPYVGLGFNYTSFFDTKASKTLATALNGKTNLSLDYSTGLAYQLGADWKVSDKIYINTALWKIDIDTKAHIDVNGSRAANVGVQIDPLVVMVGLGFAY